MMNSRQGDSKDANAEGNDSYSFDVLGKKRYFTSYNPKLNHRRYRQTVTLRVEVLFVCLFVFSY